jgi:hypothetical protein
MSMYVIVEIDESNGFCDDASTNVANALASAEIEAKISAWFSNLAQIKNCVEVYWNERTIRPEPSEWQVLELDLDAKDLMTREW